METLIWAGLAATLVAAFWLPRWRRRRALNRPMAAAMLARLERNLPVYGRLPAPLQLQLQRLVLQFLYDKKFVGCDGLVVDDDMRLTVAGQACLLLLNRHTRVYPALRTILLYPGAFLVPRKVVDAAGVITETRQDLLGESWGDGRVVLAWDHVRQGAAGGPDGGHGHNVVLHEFAHQLDSESGSTNGAPYLGSQASYRSWSQVLSRHFAALRNDAMLRQDSVLDHYGATSPAEFFAVATETFYENPWQMAEHYPALYEEFEKYYRVDPRDWQDAPQVDDDDDADDEYREYVAGSPLPGAAPHYGHWR